MAYINVSEYYQIFGKCSFEYDDDFNEYAELSSNIINSLTGYKIRNFDKLDEFTQNQVKLATASQIGEIYGNGGVTKDSSSFTLGKFSYGGDTGIDKVAISPMVYFYLEPTGLLYRGI